MSFDALRRKFREARDQERIRRQVVDQLARTPVGKLASEVSSVARSRSANRSTVDRLKRQLAALAGGASREAVARTAVANQIAEIERYAMTEPGGAWGWLKKKLGPVADTIRGLLRPNGSKQTTKEIEAAAELMNALGTSTEGAKGRRVSVQAEKSADREAAERVLRGLGFDVQPFDERVQPAVPIDPTAGMARKQLGGMFVYFNPDDPILTGEMVRVTSSNVHSIGFIWNDRTPEAGTLKVRFLDSGTNGQKSSRGGATYHYYDVHPRVFIEFQKASSKGKFVWDRLRIRGTVSGHQYRYGLMGISKSGYVPRQAVRRGSQEWFVRRTVQTVSGQTIKSQLQDRLVRKLNRGQMKSIQMHSPKPGGGRR